VKKELFFVALSGFKKVLIFLKQLIKNTVCKSYTLHLISHLFFIQKWGVVQLMLYIKEEFVFINLECLTKRMQIGKRLGI